jgi:hypothetical protein
LSKRGEGEDGVVGGDGGNVDESEKTTQDGQKTEASGGNFESGMNLLHG